MGDTEIEQRGPVLIFRVLKGEWWNHLPPGVHWDMDDDIVERPPAQWHMDLRALTKTQALDHSGIIVDLTSLDGLITQD